jgi:hypothetical protein
MEKKKRVLRLHRYLRPVSNFPQKQKKYDDNSFGLKTPMTDCELWKSANSKNETIQKLRRGLESQKKSQPRMNRNLILK